MALQRLVTRDADYLVRGLEQLEVVIGFDGADDFMHVLLRLIDYLPPMAKVTILTPACTNLPLLVIVYYSPPPLQESELKGVGLALAMGDDHNYNLALVFKRLGPAINQAIAHSITVCFYLAITSPS